MSKAVTTADDAADKATGGVAALADETKKSGSAFDSAATSIAKTAAGLITTAEAAMRLVGAVWEVFTDTLKQSVTSAAEAEESQAQLTAALVAQGTALPETISAYADYGAALQASTRFSDDAADKRDAITATIGNVMPAQMEKALAASADLAAAFKMDLSAAAELVAKAANGTTTGLQKLGIAAQDAKGHAKDFGSVLDAISDTVGGQAAASVNTYAGRLDQLANAWDDQLEAIGRAIISNQTVIDGLNAVIEGVRSLTTELAENKARWRPSATS